MTIVHLDAVGGIAGDMFVAAMLDARPDLGPRVLADAAAVLPPGSGHAHLAETMSGALRALHFGLADAAPAREHHHEAGSFRSMAAHIRAAPLAAGTAGHAIAILTVLAEAEARIHRVPVGAVHFHEIADLDSLLDVVAAGSIAAALPGATWSVSALPRGGGLVKSQHGLIPVPAPATAAILTGFEWRDDGIAGERVTPTGAAILKHLIGSPGRVHAAGRLAAEGTGAGTRTLPGIANVLRVLIFEDIQPEGTDRVLVIGFEIDDMTGEEIAVAAQRLREHAGVTDLSLGQRAGKKGRTLQSFRLLVAPDAREAVIAACFSETSTLGLRLREEERRILPRRMLRSPGGIGLKTAERPGGVTTVKAESDDIAGDSLAERRRRRQAEEDACL